MRGVGVGVDIFLPGVRCEGIGEMAARDGRGQRDIARGDALGHGHEVGHHVLVLHGEPPSRAPEARDHLVGDHEHAQLVTYGPHRLEPSQRRNDDAAG